MTSDHVENVLSWASVKLKPVTPSDEEGLTWKILICCIVSDKTQVEGNAQRLNKTILESGEPFSSTFTLNPVISKSIRWLANITQNSEGIYVIVTGRHYHAWNVL